MVDRSEILRRAKELSPWHFDFEILPGVKTASFNDPTDPDPNRRQVESIDPSEILPVLRDYYPNGFSGKDVLDVGCNSGGYCFVAHELGARSATGIDVRQHWITQAEWIKSIKYPNAGSAVNFEVGDVRRFLAGQERQFDIVIFKGVFYHLVDPIGTLLDLCDRTREVLLVDTASSDIIPEHCIAPIAESTTHVMSGVDGLAWLPGGPAAIRPILEFKGFKSFGVRYWLHGITKAHQGRFRVVASRQLHIAGAVEFFRSPNILGGWAKQADSEKPLDLRILLDGTLIGSGRTEEERGPAGKGSFTVTLMRRMTLKEMRSSAFKVCAVDVDGELHELPILTSQLLPVSGCVDSFPSPDVLSGWAQQESNDNVLEVRVLLGETLIGTTHTGFKRSLSAGNLGFSVELSQPITSENILSGAVKVYAVDDLGEVHSLPLATASLLRVSGYVDLFKSPNVLGGWARQPGSEGTLEIRALLDGTLIGTTRTGQKRLQPAGNCGFSLTLSEPITMALLRSNRIKVHAIQLAGNACELAIWPKLLEQP